MKFSKFELSVIFAAIVTFIQLVCGNTENAFYGILILILIVLMGILEYIRIYLNK